jgi:hypothetical protein
MRRYININISSDPSGAITKLCKKPIIAGFSSCRLILKRTHRRPGTHRKIQKKPSGNTRFAFDVNAIYIGTSGNLLQQSTKIR